MLGSLCLLGTAAVLFVLRFGHRVSDLGPHGDTMMTVTASTLCFSYAAAFINSASWRGSRRSVMRASLNPGTSTEMLQLGVYGLNPGESYRVIREIRNHYGTIFPVGMDLIFVRRDYLPYYGGHTVVFKPTTMYLQDEDNADVLGRLDTYLEAVASSAESDHDGR